MRVIDLFCSAGGSSHGAKLAGHTVTHAYEINPLPLDAYQENHPEVQVHEQDILELTARDLPKADIILGSTPCKAFSTVNILRQTNDMTLTNHFLSIVKDYKPRYWVLENVPTVKKFLPKDMPERRKRILQAADYGVPQNRRRLMAGNYPAPKQTHSKSPCGDLAPWKTFGDIKLPNSGNILSMKALEGAYKRANKQGLRGNRFTIQWVDDSRICRTILSSQGDRGINIGSAIIYDDGILRRMSFLEAARAQSFPDEYIFKGGYRERWRQVGDAVPPLLMKAILSGVKS